MGNWAELAVAHPTGSLLCGGIDSSVTATIAAEEHRERFGEQMMCLGFLHSNASLRLD